MVRKRSTRQGADGPIDVSVPVEGSADETGGDFKSGRVKSRGIRAAERALTDADRALADAERAFFDADRALTVADRALSDVDSAFLAAEPADVDRKRQGTATVGDRKSPLGVR